MIDADELKDIIDGSENLIDWQKDEMKLYVDACDTAYDVDKVVEYLENILTPEEKVLKILYFDPNKFGNYIHLEDAIKIVKAGGINS